MRCWGLLFVLSSNESCACFVIKSHTLDSLNKIDNNMLPALRSSLLREFQQFVPNSWQYVKLSYDIWRFVEGVTHSFPLKTINESTKKRKDLLRFFFGKIQLLLIQFASNID